MVSARSFGNTSSACGATPRVRRTSTSSVTFIVSDLRRERGPGSSRDDDRGKQRRELAEHRDADKIGDKDVCPVAPELLRALVRDDDTHQERKHADDGHCLEAGRLAPSRAAIVWYQRECYSRLRDG